MRQRGRRRGTREDSHHLRLTRVVAQQHVQQTIGDTHQVAQIRDAVLGQRRLDQAKRFQPRTGAQGGGHLGGARACQPRQQLEGLLAVSDLAIDHHGTQIALVLHQRREQQQRALMRRQAQHARQHVDVADQQHALTG